MNPKTILVPFGGHDNEIAALKYAVALAESTKAHVDVWHVSPDPRASALLGAAYGIQSYPEAIFADILKMNERNRAIAEEKFLKIAKAADIRIVKESVKAKGATAGFHAVTGEIDEIISIRGRIADLIVACRPSKNIDSTSPRIEKTLFASGRPVLLIPPGQKTKKFNGKAMIAWNGSVEATRAIQFALPFLEGNSAWVLTAQKGDARKFPLDADDLLPYLRRHGVKAEILQPLKRESSRPQSILDMAKALDAGMVVMGAFGHSRFQEVLFGGMTDYFLYHADMPVLMAH